MSRKLPEGAGYRFASSLGDWMGRRRSLEMVRAVRANQWVASSCQADSDSLDRAARETYQHTARCLYDLYHNLQDIEKLYTRVDFSPRFIQFLEDRQKPSQGLVLGGIHLSNYDLAIHAVGRRGLKAFALGVANPGSGYQWQNKLRAESGIQIIPSSANALRHAIHQLEANGTVITGLDRPLPDSKYQPSFFGRPAALPVMHIMLALKANVPIKVPYALMNHEGRYHMDISEPIEMEPYPDRHEEILRNAERVLSVAEGYIRRAPQQWAMFYPVWPEALPQIPV
ncbi:MAG TPA: lysophospholipid acyltransferase family protein [Anaerolineales bacterium]|nr:lysophospholipid acyltransferase family protein [Anaerolineales bacterium]